MNRVLAVVGRPAETTSWQAMPSAASTRRVISAPAASSPITPISMVWPPSVAMFSATLAAPPSVQRLPLGRSTGIGASGDSRCALPVT